MNLGRIVLASLSFVLMALGCIGCRSQPVAERAVEHTAPFDGGRVHYVDRGRGEQALVFIHGWASDSTVWEKQLHDLTDWRRIAIDLPGHGASSKPEIVYTMSMFARSIAAVLDDARVRRAVLVGHSNGTPVIRQFYRLYPERVAGLVIVDGALRSFFDDPKELEPFLAMMRAPDYREQVARSFVDPMLATMKSADERARVREMLLSTPQHVMVSSMQAAADPAIWGGDPIHVPTLALMAKSPFWNDEYKAYVRRLVPDLEWIEIEGVSHFVMLDAPQPFDAALRAFLARIRFSSRATEPAHAASRTNRRAALRDPFDLPDLAAVAITLERTTCFGWCPAYRVIIHGDGAVEYAGTLFVKEKGRRTAHVPPDAVVGLLEQFRASNFFALKERYDPFPNPDSRSTIVSLALGDDHRSIDNRMERWHVGLDPDDLQVLVRLDALATSIEDVAGVREWIGPDEGRRYFQ